jgi:hypothetical protein
MTVDRVFLCDCVYDECVFANDCTSVSGCVCEWECVNISMCVKVYDYVCF